MAVILTVMGGVHNGRQIPITIPEFLIGRDPRCHLRPASDDVSRMHCAIVTRQGRAFLRDYGSSNGTILNRRMLVHGELQLEDGDTIEVGPLRFKIALAAGVPPSAKEPLPPASENIHDTADFISAETESEPSPGDTVQVSKPKLPEMPEGPSDSEAILCPE